MQLFDWRLHWGPMPRLWHPQRGLSQTLIKISNQCVGKQHIICKISFHLGYNALMWRAFGKCSVVYHPCWTAVWGMHSGIKRSRAMVSGRDRYKSKIREKNQSKTCFKLDHYSAFSFLIFVFFNAVERKNADDF